MLKQQQRGTKELLRSENEKQSGLSHDIDLNHFHTQFMSYMCVCMNCCRETTNI